MRLLAFFLFLFSTSAFGQKIQIKGVFSQGRDYTLESEIFREILSANSNFEQAYSDNQNSLKINLDVSKVFKIEGMQSSYSGVAKVLFFFKNISANIDSSWVYSVNVKSNNQYTLNEDILKQFVQNRGGEKAGKAIEKVMSGNCNKLLSTVNNLVEKQSWKQAYSLAKGILDTDCSAAAEKSIKNIEAGYAKDYCENVLPRIKVLSNSGVDYKIQKAVDLLTEFPKGATCTIEIQAISAEVKAYYLNKKGTNVDISLDRSIDIILIK